jgi:hypothetical protein
MPFDLDEDLLHEHVDFPVLAFDPPDVRLELRAQRNDAARTPCGGRTLGPRRRVGTISRGACLVPRRHRGASHRADAGRLTVSGSRWIA